MDDGEGSSRKVDFAAPSKSSRTAIGETGSSKRTVINIPKILYDLPNEYDEEEEKKSAAFKSSRETKHQKIIKFPDPALTVKTTETSLKMMRDTFRSKVHVKLIYLKVL